jgi:signal transduction histidine kinase
MPMLARLRRRFILIIMGLVGLVLLVVLAVSVVSNWQSEASRIEQSLVASIGRSPEDEQRPGIGGQGQGQGPRGQMEPVYLANVDLATKTILMDNSYFVYIDSTLAGDALTRIKTLIETSGQTEGQMVSGILLNQGLFYRALVESDGSVTIALADASALITRTVQMTVISVLIWLGAMLAFFFVSLWLSKLALCPTVEAWTRQRRFIADASHELKTPLTVILANNSLLLAHPEKTVAEQERWVNSTQAEAQRMDSLVRDLLLLAQADEAAEKSGVLGNSKTAPATAPDAARERINLSELVNRNLLQFEAVFFERNIELETRIAEGVFVEGNREQLDQLLQILLDNASKYAAALQGNNTLGPGPTVLPDNTVGPGPSVLSPKHENRPRVSVALEAGGVLRVANTGEAIAPEVLPHLFERFYRGDAAHSDTEGSGLGLSLAQAIVAAHHGSIAVSSTPEAGTVFTVVL